MTLYYDFYRDKSFQFLQVEDENGAKNCMCFQNNSFGLFYYLCRFFDFYDLNKETCKFGFECLHVVN